MSDLNFDATKIEPISSFDPLPIGEYNVVVSESVMKDAKTGRGQYLQLVYTVVDGEYHGRKLFDRLNLINENATAQEIAQRSLSAICRSVNVLHPKRTEELHDKPFVVKVGIRPANGEYPPSNTIKEYKRLDGTKLSEVTNGGNVASGSVQKGKLPWAKK